MGHFPSFLCGNFHEIVPGTSPRPVENKPCLPSPKDRRRAASPGMLSVNLCFIPSRLPVAKDTGKEGDALSHASIMPSHVAGNAEAVYPVSKLCLTLSFSSQPGRTNQNEGLVLLPVPCSRVTFMKMERTETVNPCVPVPTLADNVLSIQGIRLLLTNPAMGSASYC